MYIPKIFKNNNLEETREFIEQNSFAILVSQVNNKPWATHIPLILEKNQEGIDVLQGHISKGNPQWKNFGSTQQVLAIFSGPHAYVSSSWYDHENVPTWNYIAVHIYGSLKIIEGEALRTSLKKLVDKYEKDSKNPVSIEKMSQEFLEKEIKGIVGFEITIKEIEAVKKLSQNRDEKNHTNIINELESRNDINSLLVAKEMKKTNYKNKK